MDTAERYNVRQLARLAGISPRTLHYYDEIGLLRPARDPGNRYRVYAPPDLLRLQQILFLRELGLSLDEVRKALDRPDYDLLEALEDHRRALLDRRQRLERLVATVEKTIRFLKGNLEMETKELFGGFNEEKQKEYEVQVAQRYGEETLNESRRRWGSYTAAQKQQIMDEGNAIYADLVQAIRLGPESPQAQAGIARWHQHLRYFYEPNTEILLGLGDLYNEDPQFSANFARLHPGLAEFMREAIKIYCANLSAAEAGYDK
jgi:DNA-binding transcriptional MerR regulator